MKSKCQSAPNVGVIIIENVNVTKKEMKMPEAKVKLRLRKSNFELFCYCGAETHYGSQDYQEWRNGMILKCRVCGAVYKPRIQINPGLSTIILRTRAT